MTVTDTMINGHDICHGGYIVLLADTAFAFACNTYNVVTVAQGLDVTFLESARVGDMLVAEAVERFRRGRTGLYDVTVRRGDGVVIAEFRGRSGPCRACWSRRSGSANEGRSLGGWLRKGERGRGTARPEPATPATSTRSSWPRDEIAALQLERLQ